MPYASPITQASYYAEQRENVRRYEQARQGELDRIVARIHADMDQRAANDDWASLIDYAKQGEIGPRE